MKQGLDPKELYTPMFFYGLGWLIGGYYDQVVLEHAGAIDGFSSKMTLLPRLNAGIVVLTNNQMGGDYFCNTVTARITSELMGREPFDLSSWFSKEINDEAIVKKEKGEKKEEKLKPIRDLDEYVGKYENEGYGIISITKIKDKLHFKYYRYDVDLNYQNYEVFKTVGGIINRKVIFNPGSNGQILNLTIQWDRKVSPIVFKKRS